MSTTTKNCEECAHHRAVLKKWLDVNKKPGSVRSALRYGDDGTGRVWLIAPEPKALKRAA